MTDLFIANASKTQTSDVFSVENSPKLQENKPTNHPFPSPITNLPGHIRLLSMFQKNPQSVSFNTQEDGEDVVLFLRQARVTTIPWVLGGTILLILPVFLMVFLQNTNPFTLFFPTPLPLRFIFAMTTLYYLIVLAFIFTKFISWFYTIFLVTTVRVFKLTFAGVTYKNIGAAELGNVRDVSATQIGPLSSLLDFGNVLVQTAGTIDNFLFDKIPHPNQVVDMLEELLEKTPNNDQP